MERNGMVGVLFYEEVHKMPRVVKFFQENHAHEREESVRFFRSTPHYGNCKRFRSFGKLVPRTNLTGTATTSTVAKDAYYYTVDSKGNIDFPVLGTVHVANLSREQVAEKIKKALIDASLVKDPVVTVGLSNLHYSVMGEVNHPGQFAIEDEKVTILDAISNAGDLTITGVRDDVMVLRQENGHQKIYKINLCSGKDVFSSPVYYLQQNDVVYVSPNDTKKRTSTVNGNTIQSTGFWLSVSSLAVAILTFLKVN